MLQNSHKRSAWIVRFLAATLLLSTSQLLASTGLDWLSSQINPDGSYEGAGGISTALQSTAETLRTFHSLGETNRQGTAAALQFLDADTYQSTEHLARRIIVGVGLGENVSPLVSKLLNHINADGGFGELPGYGSTPLDTAFALEALAVAGTTGGEVIAYALGYLLDRQLGNGAWPDASDRASVYITSLASHTIWRFRHLFSVDDTLTIVQAWLLAQREPSGNWGEPWLDALALIAILPTLPDTTEVQAGIDRLRGIQKSNGSWEGDVFVTALALRALKLAESPVPDPDLGSIRGRLIDAQSGLAMSGVTVRLDGQASQTFVTGADGLFEFTGLKASAYKLVVTLPEYGTLTTTVNLTLGGLVDLATLNLLKDTGSATTGTLRGKVTEAGTFKPLTGVAVTVGALNATTTEDGSYQISNVPAGQILVVAGKPGYYSASGSADLTAGGSLIFSPVLSPITEPPTPEAASLFGTVTAADTGLPLAGASVSAGGATILNTETDSQGQFRLSPLSEGLTTIQATRTGYDTLMGEILVTASAQISFTPELYPSGTVPPGDAALFGTVTDSLTNQPLAGATITLTGSTELEVQTDEAGNYHLEPLNEGLIILTVDREGYDSLTGETLVAAGQQIAFSPGLYARGTTPVRDAALYGTITDADTGLPLAAVSISVTGATVLDTRTDADGHYRIEPLNPGLIDIAVDLAGYDPVVVEASFTPGLQIAFSPELYTTDSMPQGENSASVTAVVLDASTNTPLENAVIEAIHNGTAETLETGIDGRFTLTGIVSAQVELNVSREGYVPVELSLPLTPLARLDAGQVRLRPEEIEALLPDLIPTLVDSTNAVTDPHTLDLTGSVDVTFANQGTVPLSQDISIHAFHDADLDGRFEDAIDSLLGSIWIQADLPLDTGADVEIPLRGKLPFRDAPVHVWLDSAGSVVELDEENNTSSSANRCRIDPPSLGDFDMVEKWYWGGEPHFSSVNVYGPNLVGQVTDDNGDGRIDDRDTPDVIFTMGYMAAVSGDTGETIWVNKDVTVTGGGSAAIGDIDNDGLIEIVISNRDRTRLRAFEHDGALKWSVATGPQFTNWHTRDAMAIADLDHDGFAEIIHGRRVYDNLGNFKWQGKGDHGGDIGYGTIPIVADIDLQGSMEIIAGRTVYDANGQIVWRRTDLPSSGGFTAVGNFDDDLYPEIVLVTSGRVYLLEHTGAKKWGPAIIPGGGRGAPTVGDFDGDGEPEIGIAGASRYVVYETNGSIKWQKTTQDKSSYQTGSSLFDFNADGRVEVVYADELYLRVYDGATGTVLKKKRVGSGTTLEYPVIADIDNDNHAEIVIGSNNTNYSSRRGLLALEAPDDNWAATRSIWNQHSYHITNINDDGSIPGHEQHSWLAHNSYRLNSFVDRDPLAAPDLSVALLKLVDQGAGQSLGFRLRVGNGGAAPSPDGVRLDFHEGDPDVGGALLASTTLDALPAGGYRDIVVDGITGYQGGNIYAIVDRDDRVGECEEGNNLILVAGADQASPLAEISVASDQAQYGPDAPVLLQTFVTNLGALSGDFTAQLQIEDLNGAVVQAFAAHPLLDLASNATVPLTESWNSVGNLAGTYRLRGLLQDGGGQLVHEATSLFEILHGNTGNTGIRLRTTTDKPVYHTTDQVRIDNLISNLTSNLLLDGALLHITVLDTASRPIFTIDESLGQLLPGSQIERTRLFSLIASGDGVYEIRIRLTEAGTSHILASDNIGFEVREDLAISLAGSVQIEHASLYQGDPQVCTFGLENRGVNNLPTLPLRELWVDLDNEQEIQVDMLEAGLPPGSSYSSIRGRGTGDLAVGAHGCALQAQVGDSWKTLAYGYFQVLEPPIRIESLLEVGPRGRLLVLLDASKDKDDRCDGITALNLALEFEMLGAAGTLFEASVANKYGDPIETEQSVLGEPPMPVNAMPGDNAVDLSIVRLDDLGAEIRLENRDASKGKIGTEYQFDAQLFDDQKTQSSGPIHTSCSKPIAEGAIFGDFIVTRLELVEKTDGGHGGSDKPSLSAQRAYLEARLAETGRSYEIVTDRDNFMEALYGGGFSQYLLLAEKIKLDKDVQKVLREAVFNGAGLMVAGGHDHRNAGLDEVLGIKQKGKHSHPLGISLDSSELHPATQVAFLFKDHTRMAELKGADAVGYYLDDHGNPTDAPALTLYDYGDGRSVYVGFDLLLEATAAGGQDGFFLALLNLGLDYSHPETVTMVPNGVVPVHLQVANQGIAVDGRVRLSLPAGMGVVDAGDLLPLAEETLIGDFQLEKAQTLGFDVWLSLPNDEGALLLEALIQTGAVPDLKDHAELTLGVTLTYLPGLMEARAALESDPNLYEHPLKYLEKVEKALAEDDHKKALKYLLKVTEKLQKVDAPDAADIRHWLDNTIRDIAPRALE